MNFWLHIQTKVHQFLSRREFVLREFNTQFQKVPIPYLTCTYYETDIHKWRSVNQGVFVQLWPLIKSGPYFFRISYQNYQQHHKLFWVSKTFLVPKISLTFFFIILSFVWLYCLKRYPIFCQICWVQNLKKWSKLYFGMDVQLEIQILKVIKARG